MIGTRFVALDIFSGRDCNRNNSRFYVNLLLFNNHSCAIISDTMLKYFASVLYPECVCRSS